MVQNFSSGRDRQPGCLSPLSRIAVAVRDPLCTGIDAPGSSHDRDCFFGQKAFFRTAGMSLSGKLSAEWNFELSGAVSQAERIMVRGF